MRILRDPVTVRANRAATSHWAIAWEGAASPPPPAAERSVYAYRRKRSACTGSKEDPAAGIQSGMLQPGDLPAMIVQEEDSGSRGFDRTEG